MRQQTLLNEARDQLSLFVTRVKGSTALGHTDINLIAENFLLELFKEVFDLKGLRNLNHDRQNFPGLDLADDAAGVAFQVTATPDLAKVKDTLQTVLSAGLESKYPQLRVFVITEKRASYSQAAIDAVTQGRIQFDAANDILDYRDLLRRCGQLSFESLERTVEILRKHCAPSATVSHAKAGFFLAQGVETVELNLVPIWFPSSLYVADFIDPSAAASANPTKRRRRRPPNPRRMVAKLVLQRGFDVPEDFEIHGNRLITFHDPTASHALKPYVDLGTLEPISCKAYYSADEDQLRVFKSLLRRLFQRQVRAERIRWQDERHLFFYAPIRGLEDRLIPWKGERASERTVFQRTMKNNKPDEVLTCKHLAFYVDFPCIEGTWYMAITPTWFFSRDGYRPDPYGAKRISWLKGQENDQQVHTHFRFICQHLRELQEGTLFGGRSEQHLIQIGDPQSFSNHPYLPDAVWKPPSSRGAERVGESVQSSFPV